MEITVQKATPNGYDRSQVEQKPAHRYNNRVHARRYDSPMIEQAESMGKTTLTKPQTNFAINITKPACRLLHFTGRASKIFGHISESWKAATLSIILSQDNDMF